MTNWRKHITLKDLLGSDSSEEATRKAAAGMYDRLSPEVAARDDYELRSIVDEFKDIADPSLDPGTLAGRMSLCDYFNEVLSALYDWADAERVWIA